MSEDYVLQKADALEVRRKLEVVERRERETDGETESDLVQMCEQVERTASNTSKSYLESLGFTKLQIPLEFKPW